MHGGGHERGMRSGTLATHQIVGMGEAFRIAKEEMATENERVRMLRDRLLNGLKDIEEVYINGDMEQRVPHNLNISFNFVEGESLMMALKDLAVSSGSACTSSSLEPSYVLRAIGRNDELAHSSIRFSLGRFTTEEEIDFAIEEIRKNDPTQWIRCLCLGINRKKLLPVSSQPLGITHNNVINQLFRPALFF